jgi:hypothetical protein
MHISHEVRQSEKLVITTASGRFDFGEYGIQLALLFNNVELAGFSLLLDVRQAEVDHLSNADLTAYAGAPLTPVPPKCLAILVTTDTQRELTQAYITARYTQKHYSPCRVFDQLDKALFWIKAEDK